MSSAKTPKSPPVRVDDRIVSELRRVVAEKDLRVLFYNGNADEIREQMENHTSMAETLTRRGLIEMILFEVIGYIREHGDTPKASVPDFEKDRKGFLDWNLREHQMFRLAYQNNWVRETETPKVDDFNVSDTLKSEVHSSETETPKED